MSRSVTLALILLDVSPLAYSSEYFVTFSSSLKSVSAMSVQFGKVEFGPRSVSKNGGSSFGPIHMALPDKVTVQWQLEGGKSMTDNVALKSGAPSSYDSIEFRIDENRSLSVYFILRVEDLRSVQIPLNESREAARRRTLNESLYTAAALGQLSRVQDALAQGADVNYLFGTIYPSVVRIAANGQHRDVVDVLLSKGANIKKRDLMSPMLEERAKTLNLEPK